MSNCQASGCPAKATRQWRCWNGPCPCVVEVCDLHEPDICPACGTAGAFIPPQRVLAPAPFSVQAFISDLVQARAIAASSPRAVSDQPMTDTLPCATSAEPAIGWCAGIDELAIPVRVCEHKVVRMGHSLGAMAEREKYLRQESGVRIVSGKATGPNNALFELRLLLVNRQCQTFQYAFRFCDGEGRHLLFRSTGGHVLMRNPTDLSLTQVRRHEVRCRARPGYAAVEQYVHVGCYSFFNKDTTGTDEDRFQVAEQYRKHHEEDYCRLVGASANPQLFHHSEQGVFKLLYDYPNLVAEALAQAIQAYPIKFALGPLRVAAIGIDIFTTRSACSDCRSAATVSRSADQHFFKRMKADVNSRLANKVVVDDGCLPVVRIACAASFSDCPSTPQFQLATAEQLPAVLHALPADASGSDLAEDEPDIVFINFRVPVNSPGCIQTLLTTGDHAHEPTAVMRAISMQRTLGEQINFGDLVRVVVRSGLNKPDDQIVLAMHYLRQCERKAPSSAVQVSYDKYAALLPHIRRIEYLLQVKEVCNIRADRFVSAIMRNFSLVFPDENGTCAPFVLEALMKRFANCLVGIVALNDKSNPAAASAQKMLDEFLPYYQKFMADFIESIKALIKLGLAEGTATGENSALNLAIEFGMRDYYDEQSRKD